MKKVTVPILIFLFALSILSFTMDRYSPALLPSVIASDTVMEEQINWLSWEDAMELSKVEPRKIMVNIFTDHCSWCNHMDRTTYKQPHLIHYINQKFYAVKLNAEYREPIQFKDKTYKYVKSSNQGYHELAATLTMGGLGTPALVFIDKHLEVIQPMLGYKDPDNFEMIVTYFGEDQYLSLPWDIYQANYIPMTKSQLMSTGQGDH